MKKHKTFLSAIFLTLLVLLVTGCVTTPKACRDRKLLTNKNWVVIELKVNGVLNENTGYQYFFKKNNTIAITSPEGTTKQYSWVWDNCTDFTRTAEDGTITKFTIVSIDAKNLRIKSGGNEAVLIVQ
jgi:hypothetical protein